MARGTLPILHGQRRHTSDQGPVVGEIREVLKTIELPQGQYAGHSSRIGAATAAAQAGVEDSTIQTLGRWQSAAFLQYIRMPKEKLAAVSSLLAPQAGTSASQRE